MNELYPWLAPLWQQWQNNLESGRFSNASLLIADAGLGAEQVIERVVQALMCSHFDSEPCGFCHSCQLMRAQTHPDFHQVVPEKAGKTITVDQIRHCNRLAQESSQLGGKRVIVISPAEAMNESAANALLKTLETPSENCVFLLVAHQAQHLLATIVSRCQQWRVTPPSALMLNQWLTQVSAKPVLDYAPHLNGMSPLKTLQFIEQDGVSHYQALEPLFISLVGGQSALLIDVAKQLVDEENERLTWLWYLLVDAQKWQFGLRVAHATPGAEALALQLPYARLYSQTKRLESLIEQLKTHSGLNKELLIINWLTQFEGTRCL